MINPPKTRHVTSTLLPQSLLILTGNQMLWNAIKQQQLHLLLKILTNLDFFQLIFIYITPLFNTTGHSNPLCIPPPSPGKITALVHLFTPRYLVPMETPFGTQSFGRGGVSITEDQNNTYK